MTSNLPLDLINKILIMRPRHPLAEILMSSDYHQCEECDYSYNRDIEKYDKKGYCGLRSGKDWTFQETRIRKLYYLDWLNGNKTHFGKYEKKTLRVFNYFLGKMVNIEPLSEEYKQVISHWILECNCSDETIEFNEVEYVIL